VTRSADRLELPSIAAWRHLGTAREGFEVVFLLVDPNGYHFEGHSTGVEEGQAWSISYILSVDANWRTRTAHIFGHSMLGKHELRLEGDGTGIWRVDGASAPSEIAGCLDVDLEASAFTNALPIHRLQLDVGQRADAPAVYVRALDLSVERLDQTYARLEDDGDHSRYHYAGPRFNYEDQLVYDRSGLVLDYPDLAVRVA
jgi:uncharacterized protein